MRSDTRDAAATTPPTSTTITKRLALTTGGGRTPSRSLSAIMFPAQIRHMKRSATSTITPGALRAGVADAGAAGAGRSGVSVDMAARIPRRVAVGVGTVTATRGDVTWRRQPTTRRPRGDPGGTAAHRSPRD